MTAILTLFSIAVFAQDSTVAKYRYQHEIAIDVANILTFLKKNANSYTANYRWHYHPKRALRASLNLEVSDNPVMGWAPELRVGHQWGGTIDNWTLYGGSDVSLAYFHANSLKSHIWRYGVSPVVGVRYFFNKHVSLSTEISLNCMFHKVTEEGSFDPDAGKSFYEIRFGSVGAFMISYHFGRKKV
ncbi:PorT family protein [Chitinophaga flava]|uniref:DUF3575 domain-containing protein n=1 Tax=Chitinophaga flava TaxID=2259036 RepID=A0A365Y633_9BACT|nr:PorT family protein [Chitinophaga flava]RBL93355.1 hypothetical protein DF182_12605 [Chitinophaga flava]